MKYAVVGTGAIGSVMGACLALGGGEVWFVDPFEAHINAIKEKGLDFDFNGTEHNLKNIKATTRAEEVGVVDLVLLMVKGIHTKAAMDNVKKVSDENTIILSLQNGVGNIDIIKEFGYKESNLAQGVIDFGATLREPGSVLCQIKPGQGVHFAPVDGIQKPTIEKTAKDLEASGLVVKLLEDANFKIWNKLALNCSGNAVCALVRGNLTEYLDHPLGTKLALGIQQEVVTLANAKNIPLDMDYFVGLRQKPLGPLGLHVPSTTQDMISKKPTEIEFLNGAVCREGQKLGIATPYNDVIYMLTKIYEDSYDSKYK